MSVLARLCVQPAGVWRRYISALERTPRLTKASTSVAAALLGDALAQHVSHRQHKQAWEYDWARTARLAIFNAGMGVVGHEYYAQLDGRVMPHASTSPRAIATKLCIDQLLFAPVCTLAFYAYKVTTEGRPGDLASELQTKLADTLLASWKLWIPAHIVNFAMVPNRQRILYANAVSIFGTYILSRAQAGDYSSAAKGQAARGCGSEVVGVDTVLLKER